MQPPIIPPKIDRPSPALLTYYVLSSLLSLPAVVIVLPALWIRYQTLKYELQESGIRMQVGLFFRKEVVVAFRRIQDIHVSRNIVQRWLGIASVSIQTASGNAMPEIVLEGMADPDSIRDWLYERMRGAKGLTTSSVVGDAASDLGSNPLEDNEEATELLRGIRDNLAVLVANSSQAASNNATSQKENRT
ncbi:MAG: PH domain-containing protein [Planctomycetota bacterium]|nr:PH domain-containing protein [Planctomycetota bacterium]